MSYQIIPSQHMNNHHIVVRHKVCVLFDYYVLVYMLNACLVMLTYATCTCNAVVNAPYVRKESEEQCYVYSILQLQHNIFNNHTIELHVQMSLLY